MFECVGFLLVLMDYCRFRWILLERMDPYGSLWLLGSEKYRTINECGCWCQNSVEPPTILDAPVKMQWGALNIPDPETPVGARGIGEPPVASGCCAILNAISDALGDEIFRRAPVSLDMILTSLEAGKPVTEPLTAHV